MPHLCHATHIASYRANSEDRALVIDLEDRLVILVADGAGGTVNGGAAADMLVGLVNECAAELVDVEGCVGLLTTGQHLKRRLGSGTAVPVGFERGQREGTLVMLRWSSGLPDDCPV